MCVIYLWIPKWFNDVQKKTVLFVGSVIYIFKNAVAKKSNVYSAE